MDIDDCYVEQLNEIFNDFCVEGQSKVNKEQLLKLCTRLSLDEECANHVVELAFPLCHDRNGEDVIDFNQFCECFVSALSEFSDPGTLTHPLVDDREAKPRLIRRGRSYGRKSIPEFTNKQLENFSHQAESNISLHYRVGACDDSVNDLKKLPVKECQNEFTRESYFEASGQGEVPLHGISQMLKQQSSLDSIGDVKASSDFNHTSNFFSSLERDGENAVEAVQLVEMWRRVGVGDPCLLLETLDVKYVDKGTLLDSLHLSTALERQVFDSLSLCDEQERDLTLALVGSYKQQLLHVESQLGFYQNELENMRGDLERSEIRTLKIIEEVDDHYLSMNQQSEEKVNIVEQRWSRQMRTAQQCFEKERDRIILQASLDRDGMDKELDNFQSNESLLKKKIEIFSSENNALSRENMDLCEKLASMETEMNRLRKDLECLLASKVNESPDEINTSQEEKFAMIIKDYEAQCRHLTDRIDELSSQLEQAEVSGRQLKTFNDHNNKDLYREITMAAHHDIEKFHPEKAARMQELERLVEVSRAEKRRCLDNFALEKAHLTAQLEEYRMLLCGSHDNKVLDEQHAMTMRLLQKTTKEKDELSSKYKELKEKVEIEGMQGVTNLCREFALEKSELINEQKEKVECLQGEIQSTNQKLAEEKLASQRLTELLEFEQSQHKEALSAHHDLISKFEKTFSLGNESEKFATRIQELTEQHEFEMAQLKHDQADALQAAKCHMEQKLAEVLSEKQDTQDQTSVCNELEHLQETIKVERMEMLEQLQEMRESFEQEAIELRRLVDCDKATLRQQLSEEVATLRQRLAEETESEMKRKKEMIEEDQRALKKNEEILLREAADVMLLHEQVAALENRNKDLEKLLSDATAMVQEREEECKINIDTRENTKRLEMHIKELSRKAGEKEVAIARLHRQLDVVNKACEEEKLSMTSLHARMDAKVAENLKLKLERDELVVKIQQLEKFCDAYRIENAGLLAKCSKFERSVPTPKKRRNKRNKEEQKFFHCGVQTVFNTTSFSCGDVIPSDDIVEMKETSESSVGGMKIRLAQTRKDLTDQLKRMKDLYSKLSRTELLVKDLYCENAHLMRALQVTESRQKDAEQRFLVEKDKNRVLGNLLRQMCPEVV